MPSILNVDSVLESAAEMAPLPASTVRLAAILARPGWDLDEVIEVIAFDQALTARLLRGANSAASASRVAITSVAEAVKRLGASTVLAMAVGACVRRDLMGRSTEYALQERRLWRHSVAAALAAEGLYPRCAAPIPPEATTTALLHDVGKLVLSRFLTPDVFDHLRLVAARDAPAERSEGSILELDHAEVGARMAERWNLPHAIAEGIREHHSPRRDASPGVHAVRLADVAAALIGEGSSPCAAPDNEDYSDSLAALGLAGERFDELCRDLSGRFEALAARYDA
jgi:putative nucleotidyltransferase with HDIG domain